MNKVISREYVEKNYIHKDVIMEHLKSVEKVYEREMKPYQRDYGIDVTYLSKKEKAELINKRNCLIVQMETYKQLLEETKDEDNNTVAMQKQKEQSADINKQ